MMLFTKLLKLLLNSGRAAQKGFTMASTAGAIALTAVLLATTSNSLLSLVKKESEINNANISKARMLLTAQALAVHKYGPGADGDEYLNYTGDEGGVAYLPVGKNVTPFGSVATQSNYKAEVPNIPGVPSGDGWGNKFRYCVWGYVNNDSTHKDDIRGYGEGGYSKLIGHYVGSGGSNYEDIKAHYVMALISAGPDGTIDTNCTTHIQECTSHTSVNACTQKMTTASGGAQNDDMVYAVPFFEWDMMARDAYVETSNLPMAGTNEVCVEDNEKLHWDGKSWTCVADASVTALNNILTCNDQGQIWDASEAACVSINNEVDYGYDGADLYLKNQAIWPISVYQDGTMGYNGHPRHYEYIFGGALYPSMINFCKDTDEDWVGWGCVHRPPLTSKKPNVFLVGLQTNSGGGFPEHTVRSMGNIAVGKQGSYPTIKVPTYASAGVTEQFRKTVGFVVYGVYTATNNGSLNATCQDTFSIQSSTGLHNFAVRVRPIRTTYVQDYNSDDSTAIECSYDFITIIPKHFDRTQQLMIVPKNGTLSKFEVLASIHY